MYVENEQLPERFQFPLSEFQLTDFTYTEIEAENRAVLDEIREQSLMEQEGNERILQRIKTAFLDDIAQPRRIVKGIRENIELKSFRIVKDDNISLETDMFSRLVQDRSKGKLDSRSTTLTTEDYQPSSVSSGSTDEMDDDNDSDVELNSEEQALIQCSNSPTQLMVSMNAFNTLKQPLDRKLLDGRILKALQRQEERQNKKKARLKHWEELLARKPLDDPDHPDQVQEIKEAHPNLGQFIRKTSPLYEDEHPVKEDAQRKRIVTLLMKIREIKENFNARVAKIKERKSKLIQQFETLKEELIEIQEKLVPRRRQPFPRVPQLRHEEIERDPFQIDEVEILAIKAELVRDEESRIDQGVQNSTTSSKGGSKSKLERRGSILPLGGIGAISSAKSLAKLVSEKEVKMSSLTEMAQDDIREDDEEGDENCQDLSWNMSKEEEEIQYILEQRWVFHQDQLIAKMNSLIDRFDEELLELISSKKKIDVQVKYAEIVAISMYEELQIITSSEKEENTLLENVEKVQKALDLNAAKINSKELELDQIRQNLDKYVELLKLIYDKVTYELSDNRHVEHLTKLFHVKAKYLKLPKDKDERYLCPNSNEEVEMIKPDLFREESITEDQTHPHNLDPKALEFVLDMRRRRDLVESAIRSQEKVMKKMETTLSRLQSRQNYKNTMFQEGKSTLHSFRTRKQAQINQLKVVVGLRKSQLILPQDEYDQANSPSAVMVSGPADHPSGNPEEKSDALLVYPWQHWQQLQSKSEELKLERGSFKKKFKEEKQEYLNLQEECKTLAKQIQLLNTQCSAEMAKRFGTGISMEDIEEFSTNRTLEEMREGAKRQEWGRYREIEQEQEQIKRDKQALTEAIRNNTKLVEKKTQLLRERTELETLKVSNEQTLSKELKLEQKEAEASEELRDLLKLYHSQQNELGEMHQKLAQFMTKGVHVSRIPLSPPDPATKKNIIATAKVKLNRQGSSTSSSGETDQDHDLWDPDQGSPASAVSIVVEKVD
ncbi:hypothetical protein TCAL_06632 [Tigriopus californicus]|uniref:Uncharacterized protein n=1 Tax=Tigriopus californicus TaxID=6832 RepID=A0A553PLX0_TIGCA|nr:hypothetical protein TCAL_06632 [Tigriopus californicus]